MNEQAALLRSNSRCEWISIVGDRCQNTMSLKFHHRTYDRYGHELPDDFSVLCPAHHFIADVYRKQFVGQREDIISERMGHVLWGKISGFDDQKKRKIVSRIAREWDAFWTDHEVGEIALARYFELIDYDSIKIDSIYLSGIDIDYVLLAIHYMRILYMIISIPELDEFNRVNAVIERNLLQVL